MGLTQRRRGAERNYGRKKEQTLLLLIFLFSLRLRVSA
jgi:hypothetical protein